MYSCRKPLLWLAFSQISWMPTAICGCCECLVSCIFPVYSHQNLHNIYHLLHIYHFQGSAWHIHLTAKFTGTDGQDDFSCFERTFPGSTPMLAQCWLTITSTGPTNVQHQKSLACQCQPTILVPPKASNTARLLMICISGMDKFRN